MKYLFLLFFIMTTAHAQHADYSIRPGKLHKGGSAWVEVQPETDKFTVKMTYEIIKKAWVPVPSQHLKGETILDFPPEFRDESGYLELESQGTMDLPNAHLRFLRRTIIGNKQNAYQLLVLPNNGKSKIEIIYHPELPAVGWGNVRITFISEVPLLNGYEVILDLK